MTTNDEIDFAKLLAEFPTLETERLILREPVLADAADIFVFRSDAYVQRYNSKSMEDSSEAVESIKESRAIYLRQDGISWAVTLKGQDTVIGGVGVWGLVIGVITTEPWLGMTWLVNIGEEE
jgi:ribosomal-protein-alanine N-acetyltransferase